MAKHAYIKASGEVADKIEDAAGVRYWLDDKGEGPSFDYLIPADVMPMLAAFGARTLVTNTVSSFYDAVPKGAPKGTPRPRKADAPDSDLSGLNERFAAIVAGDWGAERGGGGGVGYNLEDLLDALDEVMQAAGTQINREKVAAALADGGTFKGAALDAKGYRKAVIGVEGVKAAYEARRAAKATPTTSAVEAAADFE